jgi:hypothetical protein
MQAAAEIFPEKSITSSPAFFTVSQRISEGRANEKNEAVPPSVARESLLTSDTAQMSPVQGGSTSQLDDTYESPTPDKLEEVQELTYERYPSYPSATPSSVMINNQSSDRRGPRQRRPHRTEAERIRDFRNDPHVADVEPVSYTTNLIKMT